MFRRKQNAKDAPQNQVDTLDSVLHSSDSVSLLEWEAIPEWQRDNEYILTGYRPTSGSFKRCIYSIFAIHNETINIHSHILGTILFLTMPFYIYHLLEPRYPTATVSDATVFALYFYGVAICFFCSASFHVINNHSPKVAAFGNQLDYIGIVVLMWGATIPTVYYGFWNDQMLQIAYWVVVSTLAVFCIIATLHSKFRTPAFRVYRTAMYASLGLSALVFIIHGVMLHGWNLQNQRMSLWWMLLMAVLNMIGAALYTARIPEKQFPIRFDILGSSHQLMHTMVIFAGLAHTVGLIRAFDHVHGSATRLP